MEWALPIPASKDTMNTDPAAEAAAGEPAPAGREARGRGRRARRTRVWRVPLLIKVRHPRSPLWRRLLRRVCVCCKGAGSPFARACLASAPFTPRLPAGRSGVLPAGVTVWRQGRTPRARTAGVTAGTESGGPGRSRAAARCGRRAGAMRAAVTRPSGGTWLYSQRRGEPREISSDLLGFFGNF